MASKPKKTTCPITRAEFREKAQPINITIDNAPMTAPPREFSTGSLGWNLNSKTTMNIGGTPVTVQIGMNITLVGSKDLPGRAEQPASDDAGEGGDAAT
jgi:hypothetical protein